MSAHAKLDLAIGQYEDGWVVETELGGDWMQLRTVAGPFQTEKEAEQWIEKNAR